MEYIVEMLGIRKEFPGIVANDDITLQLKKGEIHALLGENGAGKSTLMSILFGLYQPDRGTIKVRGKEVHISNPNIANDLKIGMVHQHFKLVHNFTVTESIVLGKETTKIGVLSLKDARERVIELSKQYGLEIDPDAVIENISVGMQQRVEILKMLYRDAEVLIFDEPTAVLTPQEIRELMKIMKNLINEGKSILLITHKLNEIKAVSDRCSVIRRGKYIGTVDVKDTSEAQMAEMMVGHAVSFTIDKAECKPKDTVLKVENLCVNNYRKRLAVKNMSFEVKGGEIVGIAGVDGNGQHELADAIAGLLPPVSGKIELCSENITNASVRERIRKGLAHIPEDRQKRGLILDYTLGENMVLEVYDLEPFSKKGIINQDAVNAYAEKIVKSFDVRSGGGIMSKARTLSGGNQQKAIIGREIEREPQLIIAFQPTHGLDVGSIEYIHKRLVEHRDKGKAVLLISLELDEIMKLSDRIIVMSHGEITGQVKGGEANENQLGLLMAGVREGK